jgi:hypothetical protein
MADFDTQDDCAVKRPQPGMLSEFAAAPYQSQLQSSRATHPTRVLTVSEINIISKEIDWLQGEESLEQEDLELLAELRGRLA